MIIGRFPVEGSRPFARGPLGNTPVVVESYQVGDIITAVAVVTPEQLQRLEITAVEFKGQDISDDCTLLGYCWTREGHPSCSILCPHELYRGASPSELRLSLVAPVDCFDEDE